MKNLKTYVLGIALMTGVPLLVCNDAQGKDVSKDKKSAGNMVSGMVVDESGLAVRGAVVTVKNTAKRVRTNAKGQFSIKAGKNDTLVLLAPVREALEIAAKDVKPKKKIEMKWLQSESNQTVLMGLDEIPKFPFGSPGEWVSRNIKYPEKAWKEKRTGKVYVQFVIEKDGRVSNVRVLPKGSCPHPDLQAEAVRVVQMMPNWRPGIQKGRTVRVNYTMPITFGLQ